MLEKEARIFLSGIKENFKIIFDDAVRNKLLNWIRGGLGVTLDILFSTMMIEILGMKSFYNALLNEIDRKEDLKDIPLP